MNRKVLSVHKSHSLEICCYISISFLTGVEVNQEQTFVVDTKGAGGQGHLEVTMVSFESLVFPVITQRNT